MHNLTRSIFSDKTIIIGVVGDTHIPDRVNSLHPDLLPGLIANSVDYIFHTGDVSLPRVLLVLESIAPVFAVRGNRDFMMRRTLSKTLSLEVNRTRVLLTHGHMNALLYWADKFEYLAKGYQAKRYYRRLLKVDHDARVIVFGHSHRAENSTHRGVLFFNPGSSCSGDISSSELSYGILKFHPEGGVESELIQLQGAKICFGNWVQGENQDRNSTPIY